MKRQLERERVGKELDELEREEGAKEKRQRCLQYE